MDEQTSGDRTGRLTRRSWMKLAAAAVTGISSGVTPVGAKSTVDSGYGAGGYGAGEYGAPFSTSSSSSTVKVNGNGSAPYNDGNLVRYILETDGTIGPGDANDLENGDRTGGPTASGQVAASGGWADTFELVDGTLVDVTTWGGEVTVTVDGNQWSG